MKDGIEKHRQILRFPVSLRVGRIAAGPLHAAIKRPALNELLVKSLSRRLLLILAPDGYGKTSALWQAVQGLTHSVIWCALETTETPLAELVHGVVGRLVVLAGGSRRAAEPIERSPFGCAQALVEAVQKALPEGAHLVLDALDRCPGRTDAWAFFGMSWSSPRPDSRSP